MSVGKLFLLLVGLMVAFSSADAAPRKVEPMSAATAINKAGRQRMLTQRIVKAYCQISLNVQADKARLQLQQSVELFDSQLAELKRNAPSHEIQSALAKVEGLWGPFKAAATGPVNREGAKQLMGQSEDLLYAAHKVVLLLEDFSGTPIGRLVNTAGRQRMLSQRLAKFYMLKQMGFRNSEIEEGLIQARNEFKGALQELFAAPQNTSAIRQELELVRTQWIFLENALNPAATVEDGQILAQTAATSSERILEQMDRVTAMYEKLSI